MTFLLIFILCVIAALKITLQSMFAKHVACTNTDGILYNGFIFMAAFFMFLPYGTVFHGIHFCSVRFSEG